MIPLQAPMVRERAPGWLRSSGGRQLNGWIIDQLGLQPFQHVLEIGFGSGHLLGEVAGSLRTGFLAGAESSTSLYQQAYRRNRRFIARQLMQLHPGGLAELPYPPHYFHTVYSADGITGKDRRVELLRFTRLLRSGGRLVLVFRLPVASKEQYRSRLANRIQQDYIAAGLQHVRLESRETYFGAAVAAIGFTA
jgi:ubiquinone/menaquinone biosynthesis C-methylase UbiE